MKPTLSIHATADAVATHVATQVLEHLIAVQDESDALHLVLTGGTVGIKTVTALATVPQFASVTWSKVHIWWGDERFVAHDSPDRNAVQAAEFLRAVPEATVHQMPSFDPAAAADIATQCSAGAAQYSAELREASGGDALHFDVLLLGVGPDGHVASLFPGHDVQFDAGDAIAVADSPKPPPHRISLTLDALNRADHTYLVVAGADKAQAVAACVAATTTGALHAPERASAPSLGDGPLTAAFVGARGDLTWALDTAAAAGLN